MNNITVPNNQPLITLPDGYCPYSSIPIVAFGTQANNNNNWMGFLHRIDSTGIVSQQHTTDVVKLMSFHVIYYTP